MRLLSVLLCAGLLCLATGTARGDSINLDQLQWSVQYMIDQSQTVLGVNQSDRPRDNRGLAVSPDGRYLYAGYNNPGSYFEVRKIDLSQPDYTDATVAHLVGASRGKAIAVDDAGRVYMADGANVKIYDANLSTLQQTITVSGSAMEGVATVREGGQLVMYSTNRNDGKLTRYLVAESGGAVTGAAVDTAWGASGQITLASNIRGVEVDPSGKIWVAGYGTNSLYVVAADGLSSNTISTVSSPMDIAFDGDTALVTRYSSHLISRFDIDDLTVAGADISPPLGDLDFRTSDGALTGIVVVPGVGFYVAGEGINTANEKSTYGRTDANSGWVEGKFYTDTLVDDNDPIFFAVPEPATVTLLLAGVVFGLIATVTRRKNRG